MGDFARVTVTGTKELKARLALMHEVLREGGLRSAAFAGAAVFRDEAILQAPEFTGHVSEGHPPPGTLKKSIIVKRIEELSGPFRQTYYVTVRRGRADDGVDAYYALWVENGHFTRMPGMSDRAHRNARVAGKLPHAQWVPPKAFMRASYLIKHQEALRAIEQRLSDFLSARA